MAADQEFKKPSTVTVTRRVRIPDEEDDEEDFKLKKPAYKRTEQIQAPRAEASQPAPTRVKQTKGASKKLNDDDESLEGFLEDSEGDN